MDSPQPISMTPEQLAAVQAGHGIVHLQDPATQRTYVLIEEGEQPTLSEEYVRAKVEEGLAESARGESQPWDVEELKDDLIRRHADKNLPSG